MGVFKRHQSSDVYNYYFNNSANSSSGAIKLAQKNNQIKYNPRKNNKHYTANHISLIIPEMFVLKQISKNVKSLNKYILKKNRAFLDFNNIDFMNALGMDVLYRFHDNYSINKSLFIPSTKGKLLSAKSSGKSVESLSYKRIFFQNVFNDLAELNIYQCLMDIYTNKNVKCPLKVFNKSNYWLQNIQNLINNNRFDYKRLNKLLFDFDERKFINKLFYRRMFLLKVIKLIMNQNKPLNGIAKTLVDKVSAKKVSIPGKRILSESRTRVSLP